MTLALKEWPATIQALDQGKLIFLLRKGGIHDKGRQFSLPGPRAVLFPSFEHQKNEFLQSSDAAEAVEAYLPDQNLLVHNWVEFIDFISLEDPEIIPALSHHHIWTDEFLRKRYAWKPERPLFCVLCRTYRFAHPIDIPYQKQYGGCRSFIEIEQEIDFDRRHPVLSEAAFKQHILEVKSTLFGKGIYS